MILFFAWSALAWLATAEVELSALLQQKTDDLAKGRIVKDGKWNDVTKSWDLDSVDRSKVQQVYSSLMKRAPLRAAGESKGPKLRTLERDLKKSTRTVDQIIADAKDPQLKEMLNGMLDYMRKPKKVYRPSEIAATAESTDPRKLRLASAFRSKLEAADEHSVEDQANAYAEEAMQKSALLQVVSLYDMLKQESFREKIRSSAEAQAANTLSGTVKFNKDKAVLDLAKTGMKSLANHSQDPDELQERSTDIILPDGSVLPDPCEVDDKPDLCFSDQMTMIYFDGGSKWTRPCHTGIGGSLTYGLQYYWGSTSGMIARPFNPLQVSRGGVSWEERKGKKVHAYELQYETDYDQLVDINDFPIDLEGDVLIKQHAISFAYTTFDTDVPAVAGCDAKNQFWLEIMFGAGEQVNSARTNPTDHFPMIGGDNVLSMQSEHLIAVTMLGGDSVQLSYQATLKWEMIETPIHQFWFLFRKPYYPETGEPVYDFRFYFMRRPTDTWDENFPEDDEVDGGNTVITYMYGSDPDFIHEVKKYLIEAGVDQVVTAKHIEKSMEPEVDLMAG